MWEYHPETTANGAIFYKTGNNRAANIAEKT
jgi:hypothetical protein